MASNLENFTHYIIIVVFPVFDFFLLCMALFALHCYLKKKKNKTILVEETEAKHVDENMRVKENIVKGPHGQPESVMLSVEEDLHVDDDIIRKKKELEAQRNMHASSSSGYSQS
ncbi:hypothetical protein BC332_15725 [Capsicum chinense]|nr:hypothetical protein BC332_15725 [Capsicum chinense]